jgi:Dockerin type I domain/Planctomycete extracellular
MSRHRPRARRRQSERTRGFRAAYRRPLRIEPLEDRRLLAAVVVGNDLDLVNGDTSSIADLMAFDGGDGISLREALDAANNTAGADTISFDASLAGSTITLAAGELEITSSITISGLGADQLTISGGGQTRVFTEVGSGQRIITITDVTIADGFAPASTGGGAFFSNGANVSFHRVVMTNNNSQGNNGSTIVSAFGTLEISDSAIVNNLDVGVGAIRLQDNTTVIRNTTISGNGTRGISLFNTNSNADGLSLTNVTIANNANEGIEVVAFASTTLLEYQNTIFANNGGQGSIDARGNDAGLPSLSIVSLGHNLLDDTPAGVAAHDAALGDLRNTDPLLAPLADNGGTAPTHALLLGSPAIDAGDPAAMAGVGDVPEFDQRGVGFSRVVNGRIDIGALELQAAPPALLGDYNEDHTVNAADYTVWRNSLGQTGVTPFSGADGDGDGQITQADYSVWKNHFGAMLPPGAGGAALAAAVVEQPMEPIQPSLLRDEPAAESPAIRQLAFERAGLFDVKRDRHPSTRALPATRIDPTHVDLLLSRIARAVETAATSIGDSSDVSCRRSSPDDAARAADAVFAGLCDRLL